MNNTDTGMIKLKKKQGIAVISALSSNLAQSRLTEKVFRFIKSLQPESVRVGLKSKIMIFSLGFIFIISISLVSYFLKIGKKNLLKELDKWGTSLAINFASTAQHGTLVKDIGLLQNYLTAIMNQANMSYAAILDRKGAILAKADPDWLFTPAIHDMSIQLADTNRFIMMDGREYYNIVRPIKINSRNSLTDEQILFDNSGNFIARFDHVEYEKFDNQDLYLLGVVVLGISLENTTIKLERMRNDAVKIAIIVALICVVVIYLTANKMLLPINQLVKATGKVAHGDYSFQVVNNRRDELGTLAHSFNDMTLKLKESKARIKEYTQDLEHQISIRASKLRESEKKYRTLFEHAGTALCVISTDDRLIMINKEFEELSGYLKREAEGKLIFTDFFQWEHQQIIKELIQRNRNIELSTHPLNYECIFTDRYQNYKNVNLTLGPIPGTKQFLISISDVSKIRELQKRLVRSEQFATIGKLSASIAHEIRNPLGAINTSVGILRDGMELKEQDKELMRIICEESQRLNKIITEFLQFARPNVPQFEKTDINNLIRETLLLFREKLANNIKTRSYLDDQLPELLIDPYQIKQVMINIIVNAIDSMPRGGKLTVLSRSQKHDRLGNDYVEIAFYDSGMGISEFDLRKIFQPFFSTKEQGTGMGLAISDRIIQAHNGDLKVQSSLNKGTKFSIFLPMKMNNNQ